MVIELLARSDEEANFSLASKLQEAGAHVVYGVAGYKTHAKMLLVVRKEGAKLKRYVHLGTGNYHAGTARLYTDYGLLTSNKEIGQDVHRIFMQLTSLGSATKLKQLLQSPFTLHKGMLKSENIRAIPLSDAFSSTAESSILRTAANRWSTARALTGCREIFARASRPAFRSSRKRFASV